MCSPSRLRVFVPIVGYFLLIPAASPSLTSSHNPAAATIPTGDTKHKTQPTDVSLEDIFSRGAKLIPALKRFHYFGSFYDDFTEDFLPYGIISGDIPENSKRVSEDFETCFEDTVIRSSSDRLSALGFDLHAQISIASGLVKGSLDAGFKTSKQSNEEVAVTMISASVRTSTETLDIDSPLLRDKLIRDRIRSPHSNFVVTGIVYGYRYEIFFERKLSVSEAGRHANFSLVADLEKLTKLFAGSLRARGKYESEDNLRKDDTHVSVYGDVSLPKTDMSKESDVLDYILEQNRQMEANRAQKKGRPIYYFLSSVQVFRDSLNESYFPLAYAKAIDQQILQETLDRLDNAEVNTRRLESVSAKVSSLSDCFPRSSVEAVLTLVSSYKAAAIGYQDMLQTSLVRERNGSAGAIHLANKFHDDLPTGLKKMFEDTVQAITPYELISHTIAYLRDNSITCLDRELQKRDLVLRFPEDPVGIIFYRSDSINDYMNQWTQIMRKAIDVCRGGNITCYHVDCQFGHPLCSGEVIPEARIVYRGSQVIVHDKEVEALLADGALKSLVEGYQPPIVNISNFPAKLDSAYQALLRTHEALSLLKTEFCKLRSVLRVNDQFPSSVCPQDLRLFSSNETRQQYKKNFVTL